MLYVVYGSFAYTNAMINVRWCREKNLNKKWIADVDRLRTMINTAITSISDCSTSSELAQLRNKSKAIQITATEMEIHKALGKSKEYSFSIYTNILYEKKRPKKNLQHWIFNWYRGFYSVDFFSCSSFSWNLHLFFAFQSILEKQMFFFRCV